MTEVSLADLSQALGNWTVGHGPLYRRLAHALRQAIDRGDLAPGTRLPAERRVAEHLSISRTTVVAAFEALRDEERLERRQGSGTRVRLLSRQAAPSDPGVAVTSLLGRNTLFRRMTDGPDDTIDLLGAYLLDPAGLPLPTLRELDQQLGRLSAESGYMPLGYPPLRQAIAAHLTGAGLPTQPEQVLITQGAQQAIHLAALLYVERGDTVVVENPTYPGALDAFRSVGARLAWIPTGRYGADLEMLAELLPRVGARLVYLIPSFQNPVGGVLSAGRRQALARLIAEHHTTLLEDDSLAVLALGAEPPPPVAACAPAAPILTAGSLSKVGWGGLRVGWLRAPEAVISRLGRLKAVVDLGCALPSQVIATALFESFDTLRQARRRLLAERYQLACELLAELLPDWTWEPPQGGLCLWVRLPYGSAAEFVQLALRSGVSVAAGRIAAADGAAFDDHLRLPFGQLPEVLEAGLRRLSRAWSSYVPQAQRGATSLPVIV